MGVSLNPPPTALFCSPHLGPILTYFAAPVQLQCNSKVREQTSWRRSLGGLHQLWKTREHQTSVPTMSIPSI